MITSFLKRSILTFLDLKGFALVNKANNSTMESAFSRIAARKHVINTVIDVGASDGSWTHSFMRYYPHCEYLLIEAQPVHEAKLQDFCKKYPSAKYILSAAGEGKGIINFDASDPFGGQASHTAYSANNIQVPVITIDEATVSEKMKGPYLLKLDTHGFEVPILKGAKNVLSDTEVIVIECYNFRIAEGSLLFFEMCSHLYNLGFRCIDLVDPMYRQYDNSFWQTDLVFIKENRPEFVYSKYK